MVTGRLKGVLGDDCGVLKDLGTTRNVTLVAMSEFGGRRGRTGPVEPTMVMPM
jgi:hypothetical protein